jgi:hypothetical protein
VLYEIMERRLPFEGANQYQLGKATTEKDIPPFKDDESFKDIIPPHKDDEVFEDESFKDDDPSKDDDSLYDENLKGLIVSMMDKVIIIINVYYSIFCSVLIMIFFIMVSKS